MAHDNARTSSSNINWYLLLLAYGGLFTYGLIDNARGPLFPDLLQTFALSDAKGSMFFFLASGAALAMNLLSFYWLPKLGDVTASRLFLLCQVFALVWMGVAESFEGVLIGAALFGASMGGLGLLVNVLTARAASPSVSRRAFSGLHAMYGISSLLAPLIVTGIYALGGSWRLVLLWMLIGPAAVLVGSFFKGTRGEASVARSTDVGKSEASGGKPKVGRSMILVFSFMMSTYVVAEVLLGTRLVLYVRREAGFDVESANLLLAAFFLALFAGRTAFAFYHFPLSNRTLLWLSAGGGFVLFALGLLVHPFALVGCGLLISVFYPCAMALLSDELGPAASSVVMSWCQTFQSFFLMMMHFAIGLLSDLFGLGRALWVGPLGLAIALGCLALEGRLFRRDSPRENTVSSLP